MLSCKQMEESESSTPPPVTALPDPHEFSLPLLSPDFESLINSRRLASPSSSSVAAVALRSRSQSRAISLAGSANSSSRPGRAGTKGRSRTGTPANKPAGGSRGGSGLKGKAKEEDDDSVGVGGAANGTPTAPSTTSRAGTSRLGGVGKGLGLEDDE